MKAWVAAAMVGLTAVPLAARAGTAAEDIAEANRLLKEVREEEAIQLLSRALDRPNLSPADKAQIYVLLGYARFNMLDQEGARLAFRRALENDETAALPSYASPKMRTEFDKVRVQFAQWRRDNPKTPDKPTFIVVDNTLKTVGLIVGVVGLAGAGGGAFFATQAQGLYTNAVQNPNADTAEKNYNQAVLQRRYSVISFAGAGVALVAGAALFLWPTNSQPAAKPGPTLKPGVGPSGVSLSGTF